MLLQNGTSRKCFVTKTAQVLLWWFGFHGVSVYVYNRRLIVSNGSFSFISSAHHGLASNVFWGIFLKSCCKCGTSHSAPSGLSCNVALRYVPACRSCHNRCTWIFVSNGRFGCEFSSPYDMKISCRISCKWTFRAWNERFWGALSIHLSSQKFCCKTYR